MERDCQAAANLLPTEEKANKTDTLVFQSL